MWDVLIRPKKHGKGIMVRLSVKKGIIMYVCVRFCSVAGFVYLQNVIVLRSGT